jgi:hypothetical protein
MPSASHDQIEPREIAPGYSSRFTDWGGITVAFEKAHAGQDASAMVRGLPDDRCQAPHWGFLFSGKIVVHFDDRTETIEGGQAYYIAPGHAIEFLEDSEALEFTPTAALEETFAAIRRNSAAADSSDARAVDVED